MVRPTSPHTAMLFRAYYGLLAVSLVLISVLVNRHLVGPRNAPTELVMPAPRDASAPRGSGPTIHWGGQKR